MRPPEFSPSSTPEIRPAEPRHAAIIASIMRQTWRETYVGKDGITEADIKAVPFKQEIASIREEIVEKGKSRYWVAVEGRKTVGFGHATVGDTRGVINSLYILPDFQKRDIGSRLMDKMLEFLDQDKPVLVEVIASNLEAVDFYQKYGFQKIGYRISERFLRYAKKKVPVVQLRREAQKQIIEEIPGDFRGAIAKGLIKKAIEIVQRVEDGGKLKSDHEDFFEEENGPPNLRRYASFIKGGLKYDIWYERERDPIQLGGLSRDSLRINRADGEDFISLTVSFNREKINDEIVEKYYSGRIWVGFDDWMGKRKARYENNYLAVGGVSVFLQEMAGVVDSISE